MATLPVEEKNFEQSFRFKNSKQFFEWVEYLCQLEASKEMIQIDGNCRTSDFQKKVFPTDIVNMLFQDTQKGLFYFLACDGYHGGGSWEKVLDSKELKTFKNSIQFLGSVFKN